MSGHYRLHACMLELTREHTYVQQMDPAELPGAHAAYTRKTPDTSKVNANSLILVVDLQTASMFGCEYACLYLWICVCVYVYLHSISTQNEQAYVFVSLNEYHVCAKISVGVLVIMLEQNTGHTYTHTHMQISVHAAMIVCMCLRVYTCIRVKLRA
jgi:hypothetical protein